MTPREISSRCAYRALCAEEVSIPLFNQAWWLDSLAGGDWNVALVEKGGQIQAAMPYLVKRRHGLTVLSQPPLTQHLGPWIRPSHAKYAKQLAREKDLMQGLIDQVPDYHHFKQNWHHACGNWLPFYWRGFSQTTRYTYRIEQLGNVDELWASLQHNIRTDIRKADARHGITVRRDLGLEAFLDLNAKVFARQGIKTPYSRALVRRMDSAAVERGAREIFIAEDENGQHHAGLYLVWDSQSAYYLMGGGDPELRNSGATSLCMWEAIKFAATVTDSFDFEGSMLEPVERFFRGFGARQVAYHAISRTPSRAMKMANTLRGLAR